MVTESCELAFVMLLPLFYLCLDKRVKIHLIILYFSPHSPQLNALAIFTVLIFIFILYNALNYRIHGYVCHHSIKDVSIVCVQTIARVVDILGHYLSVGQLLVRSTVSL